METRLSFGARKSNHMWQKLVILCWVLVQTCSATDKQPNCAAGALTILSKEHAHQTTTATEWDSTVGCLIDQS